MTSGITVITAIPNLIVIMILIGTYCLGIEEGGTVHKPEETGESQVMPGTSALTVDIGLGGKVICGTTKTDIISYHRTEQELVN